MSLNNDECNKDLKNKSASNTPKNQLRKYNKTLSQIENFKYDVHHIDGDIRNNQISNLIFIPIA